MTRFHFRSFITQVACVSTIVLLSSYVRADDADDVITVQRQSNSIAELALLLKELDRDPVDAVARDGQAFLNVKVAEAALGVEVVEVKDGGAADRAGLVKGDKIVSVDEAKIESPEDLVAAVKRHPLGKPMKLAYIRSNKRYEREIRFKQSATNSPLPGVELSDNPNAVADGGLSGTSLTRVADLEDEVRSLKRQVALLRRAIRLLAEERSE